MPTGTVIRLDTASCLVLCDRETVRCSLPGLWRLTHRNKARPIAVGDVVQIARQPKGDAVVESIEPRHGGKLSRKAAGERDVEQVVAANVDQLVAVVSADEPPLNRRLLDRLVVSGEHGELAVAVCINKVDLVDAAAMEPVLGAYRRLGYAAVGTSAASGAGIDAFRELLRGKTSVFAGPSGAGKSSLLMAIQPDLKLRVRGVSDATGKGRHTTTAVRLRPLDVGGYVVDTPGIREFALWDLERGELQHCFPEIDERFGQCQFRDCTHLHEPGCAAIAAVEAGDIDPERYESYRRIYESLPDPHDYSRTR